MSFIEKLDRALDRGLSKAVFDHIRNYMICTLLFAAGVHAYHHPDQILFGTLYSNHMGWGIFLIASLLALLNFYDGARKLKVFHFNIFVNVTILIVYIVISIRVVEIILEFRTFRLL